MFKTTSQLDTHAADYLFWSFEFLLLEIVSTHFIKSGDIRYSDLLVAINAEYLKKMTNF